MKVVKYRQPIRQGQSGGDVVAVKRAMCRMHVPGSGALITVGSDRRVAGHSFAECVRTLERGLEIHQDGVYGEHVHAIVAPHFNAYERQIYRRAKLRKPPASAGKFVDVQGCPVPAKLARAILPSLRATGATLTSCYRGTDPAGEKILHLHGKHTQAQLYQGWVRRLPGFLPANAPGTSTHELRSDGAAYPQVRRGGHIAWWQCGMDVDDAHVDAFIRHLAGRGIKAWRPYPGGSEHHHINLRVPPPLRTYALPRRSRL